MTADAANLLAEIRRSGGDVRLVGCDRLKLVAPTTLLPEFAERVRAAKPTLLAALADTGQKASAAQEGGGGVFNPWRNGATAQHLTAASSSDHAIPTPAADCCARHREALAYWSAFRLASEAARLAWGEIELHWHMHYGERLPPDLCGGCRRPIGGAEALCLADDSRVHLDDLGCLIQYGTRWRAAATAALRKMGLTPPAAEDPPSMGRRSQ